MSAIDLVIRGRQHDLGDGFNVRRALPAMQRRHVGPFVFFDEMGPVEQPADKGMDVRPHPHIALATLTYLFEGAIEHRDSLGNDLVVIPGDVNWMIAGHGIAHSERTPNDIRKAAHRIHGIQAWVGLHTSEEETDPRFVHHDAAELPLVETHGCTIRLISGTAFGATAPTPTKTATIYADVRFAPGGEVAIPTTFDEVAVYVVQGSVTCQDQSFEEGAMVIFHSHAAATVRAEGTARVMILGGDRLDGPRHIWWNFVASSEERIEKAKADWKERRFPLVPGDEVEFIPLPER